MFLLKACDMDDKEREINHVNSYSSANLGVSSNRAFSVVPAHHVPSSCLPMAPPSSSASSSTAQTPVIAKGVEENLALMAGLINCYNALVAGELAPPVVIGDIHLEDVEEMDISWQIAMAVFRAKKFT